MDRREAHTKANKYRRKNDIGWLDKCQVCDNKKPNELYIPDTSHWKRVAFVCTKCHQLLKSGDILEPPLKDLHRLNPNVDTEKRIKDKIRKRLNRWYNKNKERLPPLRCQRCGISGEDKQIVKKIADPKNHFVVRTVCRSCEYELRTDADEDKPDSFDIRQLVGRDKFKIGNVINEEIPMSDDAKWMATRSAEEYISRWDLVLPKYCQVPPCDKTLKQSNYKLRFRDPREDRKVYFLCPEHSEDIYTSELPDVLGDPIDLTQLKSRSVQEGTTDAPSKV